MKRLERFFSDEDRRKIREAVAAAERRTSGEIVPYAVERSDDYGEAAWRSSVLGALAASVLAAAAHQLTEIWGVAGGLWIAAPPAFGAAVGYVACEMAPPLKRLLIPRSVVAARVAERAAQAFLSEEVFRTRERTGILLFVSLFERRVVVLGDTGITAKVRQEDWDALVNGIVEGIRAGRTGDALAEAVARCGDLLERHGVTRRDDDLDEMPDDLRTG